MKSKSEKSLISVVIPVYGKNLHIEELYNRLTSSLSKITNNYEIILVNDKSPDNAWIKIKKLTNNDSKVHGINLSRNFGQHAAITAGVRNSSGEWVVVMDCDLQDKPEEIIKLYNEAIKKSYDIVLGRREKRKDSFLKRMLSKAFYSVLRYMSEIEHDSTISSFGIYSRKVIDAFNCYSEQYRSFGMLIHFVGFEKSSIPVEHAKDKGTTSYTFKKRMDLAIDTIVANSNKPLKLSIRFGFSIFIASLLYSIYLIFNYFSVGLEVEGWTSLMVSIYLISGLIFMNLGFLGLYIGKTFDETKKRPLYLIKDKTFE